MRRKLILLALLVVVFSIAIVTGMTMTDQGKVSAAEVVYDTYAPYLYGFSPTGSLTTTSTVISFGFNDFPPSSGIDPESLYVTVDGNILTGCNITGTESGNVECVVSGLTNGTHFVEAYIADMAGNSNVIGGYFSVSPPCSERTLPVMNLSTDYGLPGSTFTVSISMDRAFADPFVLWDGNFPPNPWYWDEGSATNGTSTVTVPADAASGYHMVFAQVVDNSYGEFCVFDVTKTFYVTPACESQITIDSVNLSSETVQASGSFEINGTYTGQAVYGYILLESLDSPGMGQSIGELNFNEGTFTGTGTVPPDALTGQRTIGIYIYASETGPTYCNDSENLSIAVEEAPADTTPPEITNVYPYGDIMTGGPYGSVPYETTIYVDYVDEGLAASGIDAASVAVYLDGTALSGCIVNEGWALCPVSVGLGSHSISGSVSDNAGNTALISGSFYLFACESGKPQLALYRNRAYWASYADYTDRKLSVDSTVRNNGSTAAYDVRITGSTATNSATCLTSMPIELWQLTPGHSVPFTLTFDVPAGVGNFVAKLTASAQDSCGTIYTYPR